MISYLIGHMQACRLYVHITTTWYMHMHMLVYQPSRSRA